VAVLELELPLLSATLGRLAGGSSCAAPLSKLTRIEEAAFGFLALVALQVFRGEPATEQLFAPRLRGVNASLVDTLAEVDSIGPHLGIRLALTVGEARGQGRLFLPARLVQNALESLPESAPAPIARELLAAGVDVRVFAGRLRLELDELLSLHHGDVLLFDGLGLSRGALRGPVRFLSTSFVLTGVLGAEGFTQESSMTTPASPRDETSSLTVEVEIELTRLRLTLAELTQIRPGSLIPLRVNGTDPVILRIGDRAIARAELVELEGQVGARILHLNS
jgi:type III secretion protein Q